MNQREKDQLQKWHENDEFEKIVSALRKVPEEEMDYDLTSQLARALNNIDEYEEALSLLDSLEREGREDACWYYRRGYALYYLERFREAREMFEQAAELDPDDEDAPQFIQACGAALAYPVGIKPFRSRVEEFWDNFLKREKELRGRMDSREDLKPAMELASELLHTAFSEVYFEMGYDGERYELILTPEGMKQRLFRLQYWKERAPEELSDRWKFTVGRPACVNPERFALQMYDLSLSSGDVTVWPEVLQNNTVGLNVYAEKLLKLMEEDENKAYSLITILLDQCIGEISAIKNVSYLELMKEPELQLDEDDEAERFAEPVPLHELRAFILELNGGNADRAEGAENLCEQYTAYQMEPKMEEWRLREDVFIGITCCSPVVGDYYEGRTDIVEENARDGVIFGFLFYPNESVEQSEMVPFRAEMEDEITELADGSGQVLGGATGRVYSYIDCVCYDLCEFLNTAAKVMNKRKLEEIGFHVFRSDCGGVNLKYDDYDEEDGDLANTAIEGGQEDCSGSCGCEECAGEDQTGACGEKIDGPELAGASASAESESEAHEDPCADGEEPEDGHGKEGHFQGFVLLNTVAADLDAIMETLRRDWGIVPDEDEQGASCGCGCEDHEDACDCGECGGTGREHTHEHGHGHSHGQNHGHGQGCEDQGDDCGCGDNGCGCADDGCGCDGERDSDTTRVFYCGGCLAAVSLMPMPIPDGEAEYFAKANYMWPEAEAVTKTHKAHLLVAVLPQECSAIEAGTLYTKLVASCLKQENAVGVYTSGTVFQPEFYIEVADMMKEDEEALPILDWIYFGLYRSPKGNNAYTYGLTVFGREEIEILESEKTLEELRDFLYQISSYIIGYDEVLQDGETIGFTEEQRLPITLSKGAAVEGDSLKIEF